MTAKVTAVAQVTKSGKTNKMRHTVKISALDEKRLMFRKEKDKNQEQFQNLATIIHSVNRS